MIADDDDDLFFDVRLLLEAEREVEKDNQTILKQIE